MNDYYSAERIRPDKAKQVVEAVTRRGKIYPAHLRAWADSYGRGFGYPGANLPIWLRTVADALEDYLEEEANRS